MRHWLPGLLRFVLAISSATACSGSERLPDADLKLTTPGVFAARLDASGEYRLFRVLNALMITPNGPSTLFLRMYDEMAPDLGEAKRLAQSRSLHILLDQTVMNEAAFEAVDYQIVWYRSLPDPS